MSEINVISMISDSQCHSDIVFTNLNALASLVNSLKPFANQF